MRFKGHRVAYVRWQSQLVEFTSRNSMWQQSLTPERIPELVLPCTRLPQNLGDVPPYSCIM